MIRRMIRIDEERCNGCGACATACHEGAIGMVDGKARLLREDFCDGLGDCLPACPTGAITFEEREAPAYNEAAVRAAKQSPCGCPGGAAKALRPRMAAAEDGPGGLRNWPVQLRLAPVNAPWLSGADLVLAADCTAYACGDFHRRFLGGAALLIACPKLDDAAYAEKLAAMLRENEVRSLTVVRMDVPCCGGLTRIAQAALAASGKDIPLQVAVINR